MEEKYWAHTYFFNCVISEYYYISKHEHLFTYMKLNPYNAH